MSKNIMVIVENETVIREEVVGFIPDTSLWPKNDDNSYARRAMDTDLSIPVGYKPHLHHLKMSYNIEPEKVTKVHIIEDISDEDVRAALLSSASSHCETLISDGVFIPTLSSMFKADNGSITRLKSVRDDVRELETNSLPVNYKFRTYAGATVTITSSVEVDVLYDAVNEHIRLMLSKSADLAEQIDVMDHDQLWGTDVKAAEHWMDA
ncbi:MAG: hypothetical protein V7776_04970 [Halopseudomonas aestusnigri]